MNEAAKLVCEALLGERHKVVVLGGLKFKIYSPAIGKIAKVFKADYSVEENLTMISAMAEMPEKLDDMAKSLSIVIKCWSLPIYWWIKYRATGREVMQAVEAFNSLIRGDDFATYCKLDKERMETTANVIGQKTLLGAVATFMENLHLSYNEVVYEVPYENLLLMSADKLRVAQGDVIKEITGKEMLKKKTKQDGRDIL